MGCGLAAGSIQFLHRDRAVLRHHRNSTQSALSRTASLLVTQGLVRPATACTATVVYMSVGWLHQLCTQQSCASVVHLAPGARVGRLVRVDCKRGTQRGWEGQKLAETVF